ncbi:MFS transporter [Phytohabitans houttuyneae]|uniref:MFS transporter n=1 Tax=Phytohabitans houttuyneae TaxID=1076126 RepID=A0A6V8KB09_9ACTN|nr:MFS transporter [Phytohabitans houttuyneae]GFJ79641.1 MFS transporter [Phytohabitans houttuyneae]
MAVSATAKVASHRWIALTGLCAAAGLVWLAFADLGVSLPTISTELAIGVTDLQWTINAFSLACGALVLAAGRCSDLYGRRRVLLVGVAMFGGFSLLTAFLSGLAGLVAGRALMGVGAAMILPATLALIPPMFPKEEQPKAFGAWMAVAWVGQAAGPAVGGSLTSALGWRSLFWIAAPLSAAAFLVILRFTPESRDENASGGVDVIGLLASAAAAFCLLYAFTEGQTTGFADPLIIGLLVAAVVLGVAFVLVERRVREPLVDLRLFRARDFDGALTANLVMNIVFAGMSFLLALYLETVRGYSALEAGLLLFPSTLTILAFNPVGSRMAARLGSRTPVAWGLVLLGLGTVLAGLVSTDSPYWLLLVGLLVLGAGLGLLSVPVSNTAVAGPPPELAGTASGLFKMSSMLGGAIGVALCAAVAKGIGSGQARKDALAAGLTEDDIDKLSNALSGSDAAAAVLGQLPQGERQAVMAAYHDAYAAGVAGSVKIAGVLALVAVVVVLWLWPRRR